MPQSYTIGTLARHAGVSVETIRYYHQRGLVSEPEKRLGGIRHYADAHARRLKFIREAKQLGFSLDEVKDLLALEDGRHCREAERLGVKKLAIVRERLAQLRRIERALAVLVERCHCNRGKMHCPLISALEGP